MIGTIYFFFTPYTTSPSDDNNNNNNRKSYQKNIRSERFIKRAGGHKSNNMWKKNDKHISCIRLMLSDIYAFHYIYGFPSIRTREISTC